METPQLIEVVLRKDIQKVRKLLSNPKSNINERDWKDFSALHYATINNDLEMVALLVEEGADIEAESDKWTPLMMACCLGLERIVKYLIAQGADIYKENHLGDSFMWATISGHQNILEILSTAGQVKHSLKFGNVFIPFKIKDVFSNDKLNLPNGNIRNDKMKIIQPKNVNKKR